VTQTEAPVAPPPPTARNAASDDVARRPSPRPAALVPGPRRRRRAPALLALAFALTSAGSLAIPASVLGWDVGTFSPASEAELFALTNQARAAAGLAPLRNDSALVSIARWRSQDMGDRDYFSHNIPPSGEMVFDVMQQRGYCFTLAGENIGWNTYPDDQATATIQQMFMNSPAHRENIMGARWEVMGIGAYQAASGKKLWTVLFADKCGATATPTPKPTATPTPKPAATPTATPRPTPRSTAIPTPGPAATPKPTPAPKKTPAPSPTPEATPTPDVAPLTESAATASPTSTPRPDVDGSPRSATANPTGATNGNGPANASGPASGGGSPPGQSLRVLDRPAAQGILESIVGGVASFFFGS